MDARRSTGDRAGLPRHLRRHRLAHHDGQRPRRARLGRRRHRGRGRHARPARLDAHPEGGRLQAHRRDPGGRHRHRRRPDDHRAAAQARRGRQVRRVLRRGRRRRPAGQPGHDRQHEPRVRLDLRDLPDRRGHPRLPAPDRPRRPSRSRWSRPTPRSRGSGTTRPREVRYSEYLELDLSTVVPSLAGPKRPQDRVLLSEAKGSFRTALRDYAGSDDDGAEDRTASTRRPPSPSPPATRRRSTPSGRRYAPPEPAGTPVTTGRREPKPAPGTHGRRPRVRARPRRRRHRRRSRRARTPRTRRS